MEIRLEERTDHSDIELHNREKILSGAKRFHFWQELNAERRKNEAWRCLS